LEHALKKGNVELIEGKQAVKDLHLSDFMVTEDIGPDSAPQK